MKNFLKDLIVAVFVDPRTQEAIGAIIDRVVAKHLLPLVPVAIGAAVAEAMDELMTRIPNVEGVVDVVRTTEAARSRLNDLIPDVDVGIPALDAVMDMRRPR